MNGDVIRLLNLHQQASRFGDGLKPELLEVLLQRVPEGTFPLNAPLKSAGPAHHRISSEALRSQGIPQIGAALVHPSEKDGTDG